jgi:hypothetical protein
MSLLQLVEVPLAGLALAAASPLLERAHAAIRDAGGTLVESTWAGALGRLYLVVDGAERTRLSASLRAAELPVAEIAAVRLVGTSAVSAPRPPTHLVEWDLPANLGMEQYLRRKAEKTPLYAQVPEVQFLRTYVREDTVKCLCLYDAPDEAAVRRARAAVSAPVSRLSPVEAPPPSRDDDPTDDRR